MKRAGRTFYRNFVSFITVLFVPVMLVWGVSLEYISENHGISIAQTSSRALGQSNMELDACVRQMFNICYLVQKDSFLKHVNESSSVLDRRNASAILARYAAVCQFADTIFCYRPDQKYVFLPSTSITTETFFEQQYVYENHNIEDLEQAITSAQGIVVWPADSVTNANGNATEYVTVFIAISNRPVEARTKLGFLLPAKTIRGYFSAVLETRETAAYLFDQNMRMICSMGGSQEMARQMSDVEGLGAGVVSRREIDGKEYYVYGEQSSTTGWTVASAIPVAIAESGLMEQRRMTSAAIIAILLLGSVGVFYLTRLNYRPIERLIHTAAPNRSLTHRDDEINMIANELSRLSRQSASLHRQMELQSTEGRHALYGKLLHGGEQPDKLLAQANEYAVVLEGSLLCVAALYLHCRPTDRPEVEPLAQIIRSFFTAYPQVLVYRNESDPNRLTLILSMDAEEPGETMFVPLRDKLEEAFGIDVAIGVSDSCRSFMELPEAYRQACQALDHRIVRGNSCVCLYQDQITMNDYLQSYPTKEIEKLQWNLLQLDASNTMRVLEDIIEVMREERLSVACVRMICYDISNTVVRCFTALSANNSFVLPGKVMEEIVSFDTVEELLELLKELINDACTFLQKVKEEVKDQRIHVLLDYIAENYSSPNFSIDMIADHFQLSPSNLSHYFKAQTGRTFSAYVQDLRFSESCRLLRETDESVQTICSKVGMLNVSSYIRRFKQLYGVTPGAYRESTREK